MKIARNPHSTNSTKCALTKLVHSVAPKSGVFKSTAFVKVREGSVKGSVKGKTHFTKTAVT